MLRQYRNAPDRLETADFRGFLFSVLDPVALIASDDDAIDMATVLMQSGAAGAGGGNGVSGGDAFWESVSTAPLAAILRAVGKDGIEWALAAISRIDLDDDEDEDTPSWTAASGQLERHSTMLQSKLRSAGLRDAKMRESIAITLESAVAPWFRSTVRGTGKEITFTPELLSHQCSTLFVVAPARGVACGSSSRLYRLCREALASAAD